MPGAPEGVAEIDIVQLGKPRRLGQSDWLDQPDRPGRSYRPDRLGQPDQCDQINYLNTFNHLKQLNACTWLNPCNRPNRRGPSNGLKDVNWLNRFKFYRRGGGGGGGGVRAAGLVQPGQLRSSPEMIEIQHTDVYTTVFFNVSLRSLGYHLLKIIFQMNSRKSLKIAGFQEFP